MLVTSGLCTMFISHYTLSNSIYSFPFRSSLIFLMSSQKSTSHYFPPKYSKMLKIITWLLYNFPYYHFELARILFFLIYSLISILSVKKHKNKKLHSVLQSEWIFCFFSLNTAVVQQMPLVLKFCNCCYWQSNTITFSSS